MTSFTERRTHATKRYELARPTENGMDLDSVFETITEIHDPDYIAYFEVEWHASKLVLRKARSNIENDKIDYEQTVKEMKFNNMSIPRDKNYNFKGKGLTALCFHRYAYQDDFKDLPVWEPLYVKDVRNPPPELKDVYVSFVKRVRSEVAIPIGHVFRGKREWLPLGVLLLSKNDKANHFGDDYYNGSLRETARNFMTAACWDFLHRVDKSWRDIYHTISTDVNCLRFNTFYSNMFSALDDNITKAIKYASVWTLAGKENDASLVLQQVKDFNKNKPFNPDLVSFTLDSNNDLEHSYYNAYKGFNELFSNDKNEHNDWTPKKYEKLSDVKLKLTNKKDFMGYYELDKDDNLIIIPLLSAFNDYDDNVNSRGINIVGIITFYIASSSQNFIMDDAHLKRFSYIAGNGLYRILRNKRRIITRSVSNNAKDMEGNFENFLSKSLKEFIKIAPTQWVGLFLHNELNQELQLKTETSISGDFYLKDELGVKIDSAPKTLLREIFESFNNDLNSECYYGTNNDTKEICKDLSKNKDWVNSIKSYMPKNRKSSPNYSCIVSPILGENKCRGILVLINPMLNIDQNLEKGIEKEQVYRVASFSREIGMLTEHFTETLSPYIILHHYYEESQLSSRVQAHEIIHDARAIVGRSELLINESSFLVTDSPTKTYANIIKTAEKILKNGDISSLVKEIQYELLELHNNWRRLDNQKAIERLEDIERWSRIILFLSDQKRAFDYKIKESEIVSCDIDKLLYKLVRVYKSEYKRKVKILIYDNKSSHIEKVKSVPSMLNMILWNLLSNSFHYSFECTPVRIQIGIADNCDIEIIFTNYGIEIEDKYIKNRSIFKHAWRGEEARKIRDTGTGIGLAVVDHLLYKLGIGTIKVRSSEEFEKNFFLRYFVDRNRNINSELHIVDELNSEEINVQVRKIIKQENCDIDDMDEVFRTNLENKKCLNGLNRNAWNSLINRKVYKNEFILCIPQSVVNEEI